MGNCCCQQVRYIPVPIKIKVNLVYIDNINVKYAVANLKSMDPNVDSNTLTIESMTWRSNNDPTMVMYAITAEDTKQVVGAITYWITLRNYDELWIDGLVIPDYQQYGGPAIDALIERILRNKPECKSIKVDIRADKPYLRKFYESNGFVTDGFPDRDYKIRMSRIIRY